MESENTKINSLLERRFGSIIFLLRLAGIPFQMKKISTIYAVYTATLNFCSFLTSVGMLSDVYVHRNDLERAVATLRVLIPLWNSLWIYTYFRYVRKLTISVSTTEVFSKHNITFTALIKRGAILVQRIV
jgi:hypothetical protein